MFFMCDKLKKKCKYVSICFLIGRLITVIASFYFLLVRCSFLIMQFCLCNTLYCQFLINKQTSYLQMMPVLFLNSEMYRIIIFLLFFFLHLVDLVMLSSF